MSDSAHQGDAARLEAALERIVRALDRAVPTPPVPDAAAPEGGSAGASAGQAAAGGSDQAAGGREHGDGVDLVAIGARLDGLILELREALGETGPSDSGADHPQGGEASQSPDARAAVVATGMAASGAIVTGATGAVASGAAVN